MIKVLSKKDDILHLAADTLTDLDTAENELNTIIGMGSKATVIDIGCEFMLNSAGRWCLIRNLKYDSDTNWFSNPQYVSGVTYNNSKYVSGNAENRMYYIRVLPNSTYEVSKTLGSFMRVVVSPSPPAIGGSITTANTDTSANTATISTSENDDYLAIYPLLKSELQAITYDEVIKTIKVFKR